MPQGQSMCGFDGGNGLLERAGSRSPLPSRRTLAAPILGFTRSDLPALRPPACAGQIRRLNGRGQPRSSLFPVEEASGSPCPGDGVADQLSHLSHLHANTRHRAAVRLAGPRPLVFNRASGPDGRVGSRALLGDRKPSPTPGRRRRRESRQAQRRQVRVSRSLEGGGERPARGFGEPEAGASE
jgi:hypothetical protein